MKNAAFSILTAMLLTGCATRGFPPAGEIQNFDVVDKKVCRGAQPNYLGFEWLAGRGVTTILNLRGDDAWADEERVCLSLKMNYFNVPMSGLGAPDRETVEQALAVMEKAQGMVFVHCMAGADRTGVVIACYRIRHGETAVTALSDAKIHGLSAWFIGGSQRIKGFK